MKNPERIIILFASVLLSVSQVESAGGFPHLKIGSLDPLYIPKIVMTQGSGPVSIEMTATDQIFRGISNYKINSANVDLQNYKMEFTASLPWLFVEGNTKMEGRVLVLPIKGSGESWSNYTTVGAKAVLTGHPLRRASKEYFSLDNIKFEMTVKQGTVHLNNLFNGNQELGEAMNKLMSENWEVVYQELKPVIEQTAAALVKDIAVKVLDHYSLDDMFPK